uniref:Uncharacterized protein n=1 Tax=Parastrongyloides trichosuri TaxID=131310 RepID=A0A0N4Z4B0_PARTI
MCHSRKELPFASIKSPRRNTALTDLESLSSNLSLDGTVASKLSITKSRENSVNIEGIRKYSTNRRQSDYLHPKYSLPPIKIQLDDRVLLMEFENILRTPISTNSPSSKVSSSKHSPIQHSSIENEEEDTNNISSNNSCSGSCRPLLSINNYPVEPMNENPIPIQNTHLLTVPTIINKNPCASLLPV